MKGQKPAKRKKKKTGAGKRRIRKSRKKKKPAKKRPGCQPGKKNSKRGGGKVYGHCKVSARLAKKKSHKQHSRE